MTEPDLIKLHRKVRHTEKVRHAQAVCYHGHGQGHNQQSSVLMGPLGLLVTHCKVSHCLKNRCLVFVFLHSHTPKPSTSYSAPDKE